MRKGIAVSPGIAVGKAYCIHEVYVDPGRERLDDREISAELARYEVARDAVSRELKTLHDKVETQVGHEAAAIFAAHEAILRDTAFTDRVRDWVVNERLSAPAALHRLLAEYTKLFNQSDDSYLQERLGDVREVVIRLSAYLSDVLQPDRETELDGPLIVVADELLPSQAVALGPVDVQGIITQRGSQTSHAAIIARSRGIPAVAGIDQILGSVKTGDTIVIDGREGLVLINPDPEALAAYRKLEREFFTLKGQFEETREHPAVTADGTRIQLLANINGVGDAKAAMAVGADGIGLYRTEYLYMTHTSVPDEEEQLAVYRDVIEQSPGLSVTIRTLDIGGDKTVPFLGHTRQESNPFLGWRSIRLSFEHPEFFATQIRAVLRAAAEADAPPGRVRLMFPMITTVEEIRRVRAIVRRAERRLKQEKKPYLQVPIGMMLEVPAAAVSLDMMVADVDFVSIGSNDLVQYLMAADRDNPKVNHLCQPLNPSVLRVLNAAIRTCHWSKTPVTLCGEMAGQPRAFVLLLGMGLRNFSMSPAFIPRMKKLASRVQIGEAEQLLRNVLKMKTTTQIQRYMAGEMERIVPEMTLLDSV